MTIRRSALRHAAQPDAVAPTRYSQPRLASRPRPAAGLGG